MFTSIQSETLVSNCAESIPNDLKLDLVDHNLAEIKQDLAGVLNKFNCQYCNFQTYSYLVFCKHQCKPWELKIEGDCSIDSFNCANILELYKCTNCDFCTNLKILLIWHASQVHKNRALCDSFTAIDVQKRLICAKCRLQTCSLLVLHFHVCTLIKRERDEKQMLLQCEYCNFKSKYKICVQRHVSAKHPPGKLYKCKHCDFTFSQKIDLDSHLLRVHTEETLKPFHCKYCDYKNKREDLLTKHLRLKHEIGAWFQCEHCEFQTKDKRSLKFHTSRRHTAENDIKWIKCDFCSYLGKERAYLSKHVWNKHKLKI